MFNHVSMKNPLESETVGERRERKAKESDGSLCSTSSKRSSISATHDTSTTKSIKSGKFSVFGAFSRASNECALRIPDLPALNITVTKSFDVAEHEVEALEDQSTPGPLLTPPISSGGCAELSASPSISRPSSRIRKSPTVVPVDQFGGRPMSFYGDLSSASRAECTFEPKTRSTARVTVAEPDAPSKRSTDPVESKQQDANRPDVSRNKSNLSTASTLRSERSPVSTPKTIPEEMFHGNIDLITSLQTSKDQTIVNIQPSAASTPDIHDISLSPPTSPPPTIEPTATQDGYFQLGGSHVENSVAPPNNCRLYLRIMERASNQILCQRVAENWDGIESDLARHVAFEKRSWALTALQRLDEGLRNGNGRPVVEGEGMDSVMSNGTNRKVVHICDVGVESWIHATANPQVTVSCLTPSSSPEISTLPWGVPPNVDFQVWASSPSLPFENGSVDVISSRSIASLLRSHDWPTVLRESARVLRANGSLEISVLDPMPRNAGPLLQQWTTAYLVLGLERQFVATRPAMVIPFWLKDVPEFGLPRIETVVFSAVTNEDVDTLEAGHPDLEGIDDTHPRLAGTHRRQRSDVSKLRTVVGRHFYQSLYKDLAPEGRPKRCLTPGAEDDHELIRHWWWKDPAIVRECREYGTMFEMVTFTCQRKGST